jgi:hypothetical protein
MLTVNITCDRNGFPHMVGKLARPEGQASSVARENGAGIQAFAHHHAETSGLERFRRGITRGFSAGSEQVLIKSLRIKASLTLEHKRPVSSHDPGQAQQHATGLKHDTLSASALCEAQLVSFTLLP